MNGPAMKYVLHINCKANSFLILSLLVPPAVEVEEAKAAIVCVFFSAFYF
jgi:hypothetical protein